MRSSALLLGLAVGVLSSPMTAQVQFVNVAEQIGIVNPSYGRGAASIDLDGDGLLDLVGANAGAANAFFRQLPDHTFEAANDAWGIPDDTWSAWAIVATDLDGDGDVDCFFGNGGFQYSQPNQVLRNDLDATGTFSDVSPASGDALISSNIFGATSLDYDNDGDVDIYLSGQLDRNLLLRNDGDLTFTDVATSAGLGEVVEYRHAGAGDYDNDGWIDIGVGHHQGSNRLFRNNADASFTDVAQAAGIHAIDSMFGFVFEDFDNDGWLDVYLPNYDNGTAADSDYVYLNNRDGTFRNVTPGSGLTPALAMGHNTADVDGDGNPDIFVGTGRAGAGLLDALFLVEPDGAGGIVATDVSASSGILTGGLTRCHGTAFFDYEQDGDLDFWANNGGPEWLASTLEDDDFWQNQSAATPFATLRLQGVISNRSAVHARAVAVTSSGRSIWRHLTAGKGFGNTDSPVLLFPLQPGETLTRLEVRWPSGIVQRNWWPSTGEPFAMLETGLRTVDQALPGVITTLEIAGAPNSTAGILLGLDEAFIPLQGFGGVLEIFPLLAGPLPIGLGEPGRLALPIPEVADPQLTGLDLRVQALMQGGGSHTLLTNTLVVTLE